VRACRTRRAIAPPMGRDRRCSERPWFVAELAASSYPPSIDVARADDRARVNLSRARGKDTLI